MIKEFSKFSVEIKNQVFRSDDGLSFPKTAFLTFVSPDGHHESLEEYGYQTEQEIFRMISEGKPLNLDRCYIDAFSLAEYRRQNGLDRKSPVKITGFSARDCFFNNKFPIDLSYAEFTDSKVSFEGSNFVKSSLDIHGTVISGGGLDFSNTLLPNDDLNFTNMNIGAGDLSFKNAHFGTGSKDFQDTQIGQGDVSFVNTEFNNGDVSFVNTQFGDGNISFKVARFGEGRVDFHFAKVGAGDISFERTEFGNGKVDFRTVEFGTGRVNFNRAVFGDGDISFEASQLKHGKISFLRAEFGKGNKTFELAEYDDVDATFERVDFGEGNISFYNACLKTLSLKSCHLDHYLDLRVARCSYIDLSDTIARDIIDLQPYDFKVHVDTINFAGMRLIGRIYIDWDRNDVKKLIMSQEETSKKLKAEQFRTLKENFNITGQYSYEDKAYVEFKRLESKTILEEVVKEKPVSAIWQYPLYGFKLVVFDWAGLYATNPVRVMISMIVCYSIFSLITVLLVLTTKAQIIFAYDDSSLSLVGKSFYYMAITFLTIGYGDYYPEGALHGLAGVVGWVGLFLMSYFTVAFVRKVLR